MKKVTIVIIAAAVVVAGAAAVYMYINRNNTTKSNSSTSSTNKSATSNTSSADVQQSNPDKSKPQSTNSVSITNFTFSPSAITIKKGTTVKWTNNDATTHTVTETDDQDGVNGESVEPGKTYSYTFNTAGTFQYNCAIHPSMTGIVTVTD